MSTRLLILDACVLIDYVDADASVLGTVSTHVARAAVVRSVFDEVDQLDERQAAQLGLSILDVPLDLAAKAAETPSRLSFQDRLCLLVAREEGWTCVTNDGALRRACIAENVPVLWGLEIMAEAVEVGAMTPDEAVFVAEAIHEQNPRYVTCAIVESFRQKVRS